jgi:hypothetical protein
MYIVRPSPLSTPPPPAGSTAGLAAADDYRRAARHLRHRFRDNPAQLQRSLRRLSESQPPPLAHLREAPDDPADRFAHAVVAAMDGPVLRYSARQLLLHQAARLGLGRFESNLIIAAIEHRLRPTCVPPLTKPRRRLRTLLPAAGLIILVQTLILWAAWSLFL